MTTYEKPEYHDQSNIAFIISFFLSLISVLFCGLYGNPFNIYFGIMLLAELFLAFSAISVQHSHPVIHVLIHIAAFLLPVITFIFQPDWQSAGTASFAYFVLVSSAKIKHKKANRRTYPKLLSNLKCQNYGQIGMSSRDIFPRGIKRSTERSKPFFITMP